MSSESPHPGVGAWTPDRIEAIDVPEGPSWVVYRDWPRNVLEEWPRSLTWMNERHDRPRISLHAQDRWDDRTPWWSHSIEYAYQVGVPIFEINYTAFAQQDGEKPDLVRVFGEHTEHGVYAVLLFIVNDCLTTVYRVGPASISPPLKCYLWRLVVQQGHLEYDSEPHEGVQNE